MGHSNSRLQVLWLTLLPSLQILYLLLDQLARVNQDPSGLPISCAPLGGATIMVVLEQILDVIGCEPGVPDNELRNLFRGLGEM